MTDDEKMLNGTILTPADNTKREFTPRDLNDTQLATIDHATWLEDFSKTMATGTAVQMTPFRQGVVTRAHWAARYIKMLEKSLRRQEEQIARLRFSPERIPGLDITPAMIEAGRKEIAGALSDLVDEAGANQIVIDVFSEMMAAMLEGDVTPSGNVAP